MKGTKHLEVEMSHGPSYRGSSREESKGGGSEAVCGQRRLRVQGFVPYILPLKQLVAMPPVGATWAEPSGALQRAGNWDSLLEVRGREEVGCGGKYRLCKQQGLLRIFLRSWKRSREWRS